MAAFTAACIQLHVPCRMPDTDQLMLLDACLMLLAFCCVPDTAQLLLLDARLMLLASCCMLLAAYEAGIVEGGWELLYDFMHMDVQQIELHGFCSDTFRLITGVAQGKKWASTSLAARTHGFATWYQTRQLLHMHGCPPSQRRPCSTPLLWLHL